MKRLITIQAILISFCIPAILLFAACSSGKQLTTATPEEITHAINNDHWKFSANNVMPSYGRSRTLTSDYFVTINNKKLVVALPYIGKLNSSAGALDGNPLNFESTSFDLSKETRSNGGWLITIKSPDPEVQSMIFTFFDNGSAQLNIAMTNRSGISYSGSVTPVTAGA